MYQQNGDGDMTASKMGQIGGSVSAAGNEARNAYVVEQITATLIGMLEDRPLEEISISELCVRAQVGRASFYRNFSGKEDVLRRRVRHLFATWGESHQQEGDASVSALVRSLFAHFEENRSFYRLLESRGLIHLIEDAMLAGVGFDPAGPKEAAYTSAYAAYVLYGWTAVWFRRGMRESADELADMLEAAGL